MVRVVADECGISDKLQLEEVALTPVSTPDSLGSENPLGKIPSLVLDSGECLYDSRVICEYLDSEFNGGLYPSSGKERWSALRLQAIAVGFCDAAVLVRYEGFVRPQDKQWSDWVDGQLNKCRKPGVTKHQHLQNGMKIFHNALHCCRPSQRDNYAPPGCT